MTGRPPDGSERRPTGTTPTPISSATLAKVQTNIPPGGDGPRSFCTWCDGRISADQVACDRCRLAVIQQARRGRQARLEMRPLKQWAADS
jgi:predicted nucleic acid-binding Zn ribbon protein